MRASANYFFEFGHFYLNSAEHLLSTGEGRAARFLYLHSGRRNPVANRLNQLEFFSFLGALSIASGRKQ
jgi:hypothetical protein